MSSGLPWRSIDILDYGIDSDDCLSYVLSGTDASPGEFPHQVYFASPKIKCGGTILNDHFILTAAHCFIRRNGTLRESAYTWKVVGGDTDLNSTEGTEQERSMSIIYTHPNYKPGTPYNDIALVKLKRPFVLNNFLKAPILPNEDFVLQFNKYSALTVSGYGDLSYQGVRPTKLQNTYLSLYTTFECQGAYVNETFEMTDKIICAGGKGRDSCQGDSGGPLIFTRCPDYESILVGVVLGGIECGREEYPGMYTKVSEYTKWIQTSLENTSIWGLTQGDFAQSGCCQNGGSCFVGTYSNSYSCLCLEGFRGLNCESVDLCGPCDYRKMCVCPYGQVKDRNDSTRCMSVNSSATLLVSTVLSSNPGSTIMIELPIIGFQSAQRSQNVSNIRSFDYHFQAQTLFWIDTHNTTIYSGPVGDGAITGKKVLLHDPTLQLESLAVDWIHQHIYWVDSGSHSVAMSNLNGTMRRSIFSGDGSNPISVVVNPLIGWIYWIESSSGAIEKAKLGGAERQIFSTWSNESYTAAKGLAVDVIGNRLYWISADVNGFHSINFDGSDIRQTRPEHLYFYRISSMSIFEDYAYVIKPEEGTIYKINKCNGKEATPVFQAAELDLRELKIYSASSQPDAENPCEKRILKCSHFCFPDSHATVSNDVASTSECACPDGLTLSSDQVNCI